MFWFFFRAELNSWHSGLITLSFNKMLLNIITLHFAIWLKSLEWIQNKQLSLPFTQIVFVKWLRYDEFETTSCMIKECNYFLPLILLSRSVREIVLSRFFLYLFIYNNTRLRNKMEKRFSMDYFSKKNCFSFNPVTYWWVFY